MIFVLIGLGSSLGAVCRYMTTKILKIESTWPWSTLLINLSGSFLLGILFGEKLSTSLYSIWGIGFLGGYTTFSTLNIELLDFHLTHKYGLEFAYAIASYLLGLLLIFLGIIVGKTLK